MIELFYAAFLLAADFSETEPGDGCTRSYERIDDGVFYRCRPLRNADSHSFSILNNRYARDKNRIYCQGKPLSQASTDFFVPLSIRYATDGTRVFHDCDLMEEADAKTFTVYPSFMGHAYAKDKARAYYEGKPLDGADSASFTVLGPGVAKDKRFAYRYGIVEPLTPAAASYPSFPYTKTAWTVFYHGKALPGADPATFEEQILVPASMKLSVARDQNTLWVENVPYPFPQPAKQIGSPSGSDLPFWLLGREKLLYLNVDEKKQPIVAIAPVRAETLRMFPYAAYATDGENVIHRGTIMAEADAETFVALSGVIGRFFSNGVPQYAFDRHRFYRENDTVFEFDGDAELLWPPIDSEGRSPHVSTNVFLFRDGETLRLVHLRRAQTCCVENSEDVVWSTPDVAASAYRLVSPVRKQPSDSYETLIGTDGELVFSNDGVMEGVSPEGLQSFRTSYQQGVVAGNALLLHGYGRLQARNTETGEIHTIGQEGWRHVRITEDNGQPDRAEFFDGRMHVHIERYLHLWEDGETPDSTAWEAYRP